MVADFDGTYHAILGQPSLTKFMAIPHYRYLVLKMPIEKGVLTLRGNVYAAYTCEDDSFKIAEAHDLSIRMVETMLDAKKTSVNHLEILELEAPCKNIKTKEHKVIQLVDGDPSKMALIGANLDPK
jgi:hypothetical protein